MKDLDINFPLEKFEKLGSNLEFMIDSQINVGTVTGFLLSRQLDNNFKFNSVNVSRSIFKRRKLLVMYLPLDSSDMQITFKNSNEVIRLQKLRSLRFKLAKLVAEDDIDDDAEGLMK